ncbi:putative aminoacyltransferase, E1 ubiquitin-activating enzyme [Medicago truncatula]|uniref:RBR-type E3 ubiquitin transferase n=1 Tax=Medicago truncatula TaxID=3880 RepID=A0A396I7H7_MEDTR|nr:putative aminoacyltransferase, E1 ubiquitin-activating enzyme [Medicago truncatula]
MEQHFYVLSESDIKRLQDADINHLSSILFVSRPVACLLLSHYNWNVTQASESWFDNQQKVRNAIGLSNETHIELGLAYSSHTLICGICLEIFSSEAIRSSWCRHSFCINCWNQYVDTHIDDHNCFKLKCPEPSCNAAVDEDMIQQLASESRKIKYDQFFFRSYVENNNNMKLKWCPAPDCCNAISYELPYHHGSSSSRINYDVTCLCYHSFCWNCGEEAHTPVDCEIVAKWMKKTSSEFKITTNGWIIANTKRCPKCKTPIEKNNGCNHMSCKCGIQFCWLCLRDFSNCRDGVNCAQVQEFQELFGDEMQRNHAKNHLDRYTYYHQGWANNEISRKKSGTNFGNFMVKDALKHIVECRRILRWSYVYGYYLPEDENAKIEFFDHIQSIAQVVLDRLHHFAENGLRKQLLHNGSEEEFCDFRTKLTTRARVAKSYFMNLVKELDNGLEVVCVKNYAAV